MSLIAPHGGVLVNRILTGAERAARLERYYPKDRILLGAYPAAMRYGGGLGELPA